jgi:hypothetical protein
MSTIILSIGAMVFLSHFLSLLFKKTNIPDVLVLMGVALLMEPVLVAAAMMGLVFTSRIVMTRLVLRADDFSTRDKAIASMLAPKRLAAAVLAAVPLQYGVPGAEVIRDTT